MDDIAMVDTLSIEWVLLDKITVWRQNYNHGDIGAITQSIRKFGFNNSLRVWQGTVMAGNHSLIASRQLSKTDWTPFGGALRIIDGEWWVSIVDVSHLSEQEAVAFAIADNRTAELATHDDEILTGLLQDLAAQDMVLLESTGYDGDDLDHLLSQIDYIGFPIISADKNASQPMAGGFSTIGKVKNPKYGQFVCADESCLIPIETARRLIERLGIENGNSLSERVISLVETICN